MKKIIFILAMFISAFANAGVYTLDSQILQVIIEEARSITVLDEAGNVAPSNKQLASRFAKAMRNGDLSENAELAVSLDGVTFSCEERDGIGNDLVYGCGLDFFEGPDAEDVTMYYIEVLISPENNISIITDTVAPESAD